MSFKVNWKSLGVSGVIILVLLGVMVFSGANRDRFYEVERSESSFEDLDVVVNDGLEELPSKEVSEVLVSSSPKKAIVYVCGAVNSPMVIELTEEDRLNRAVELAGGLKDSANREGVNLAMRLRDGAQYIIPDKGEELVINFDGGNALSVSQGGFVDLGQGALVDGKVNINVATDKELQELTGIGEVLSQRIVDYRQENKGFKSVEELKQVEGIGDKKFEDIKDEVVI